MEREREERNIKGLAICILPFSFQLEALENHFNLPSLTALKKRAAIESRKSNESKI
jgi:hypothetical protein